MGNKVYVMYNKKTNARIRCTEKYLIAWIAMGFDIEEIILDQPITV